MFFVARVHAASYLAARSRLRDTPPELKGPTRWTFSESESTAESPAARAEFQWRSVLRVRETKRQFLLFPQKQIAGVIPKRCFLSETEISEFREMVRRCVPTATLQASAE